MELNASNTKDYTDFVCSVLDEVKELFLNKNKQYANENPLNNFAWGCMLNGKTATISNMFDEALGYERKHLAHVLSKGIDAEKLDESLKDIIVYSAIELYMLHLHKQMYTEGSSSSGGTALYIC